jgi:hypothetical protein
MAKTWQNVIDEARVILQDVDAPPRHSDEVLLAILNRGLQELARLRPDAFWEFFHSDTVIVPEIVVVDPDPDDNPDDFDPDEDGQLALTANFALEMMFYTPLVYWVASSAELVDDEFTNDGRVVLLQNQFKSMVVSL